MVEDSDNGLVPLYRNKNWKRAERRIQKERKNMARQLAEQTSAAQATPPAAGGVQALPHALAAHAKKGCRLYVCWRSHKSS